ncbi:MAG: ABC transporter permease subunit [Oscillospiraceae bacterium]|nr:ABC transporter permease subunit [Oscillospiraceae bacterium]
MEHKNSIGRSKIGGVLVIIFLTLLSLIVLYPLVYVVTAAFTPGRGIATLPIIPFTNGATLDHFVQLFTDTNYPIWFRNTFQVAVVTSMGTLIISALGAYTLSRFRFALKKSFMLAILVLQVFPSVIGMIAIFVILLRFGLWDNLWGLTLVYLAGNAPFNIWLLKSYLDTIPRSLDEAARVDGASHFRTFLTIVMPTAKPMIVFVLLTSFTMPWMDFILPRLILRSPDNITLAIGLFNFITERRNDFTLFAAGAILIAIPFIIFFILTQKTLVTSLGAGAVKE